MFRSKFYLLSLLVGLCLAASVSALILLQHQEKDGFAETYYNEQSFFEEIQQWRSSKNLPKYKIDQALCDLAKLRLNQILVDLSHDKLDDAYLSSDKWTKFNTVAENIALGVYSPGDAVTLWNDSASHSATMRSDFLASCVALHRYDKGTNERSPKYTVVQIFGK